MQRNVHHLNAAPSSKLAAHAQDNQIFDGSIAPMRDRIAAIEPVKTLLPKQAATLLGIDAKTLANWRWRGCGPNFIKLPGRGGKGPVRYDRDTVLQWLGEHTRRSTSDTWDGEGRK